MRILVTGATGFIGGHLAKKLVKEGHQVKALVRIPNRSLEAQGISLVQGEIYDPKAVRAAVKGNDAIFHLAAIRDEWGTPLSDYHRINVDGTSCILDAAVASGVKRLVHCSSVGVARYPTNLAADETLPYRKATSQIPYHVTKTLAEQKVLEWAQTGKVPAVVIRPVITYGPEDFTGMVTNLIRLITKRRFIPVGSGVNHVDLVYVDDLVNGMYSLLRKGRIGQVYNLSGTAPIQIKEVIAKLYQLLNRQLPPVYVPTPFAYAVGWATEMLCRLITQLGVSPTPFITRDKVATLVVDRGFSHDKARAELDYQPRIDYDEGLRRTVQWFKNR